MKNHKLFLSILLSTGALLFGCNNESTEVIEEPQIEIDEDIKNDEIKLDWYLTIQEEVKDCDYYLIDVNSHTSLDAYLNNETPGPWLVFQLDMTRDEYISYANSSSGKAFEEKFFMKDLSEKYRNTLFDLVDSEGYTIYSYENGEEVISVDDWIED